MTYLIHAAFILLYLTAPANVRAQTASVDSLEQAKRHFSFAVQHKNNDEHDLAREQYRLSIAYVDTIYQVRFSYADLLMEMKLFREARMEYLSVLNINPGHFKSASMLARIYHESAEYDSALVMYGIMGRLEPENNDILAGTAGLLDYLGRDGEALEAYDSLIGRSVASFDNLLRAAELAFEAEDFEKAVRYAEKALELRPGDVASMKLTVAAHIKTGAIDNAALSLRLLVEADPEDDESLSRLEDMCRSSGDHDNLVWALERHHERVPGNPAVTGELAELLLYADQDEQAAVYLAKGLETAPEDGRLHILMGEYHRRRGDDDKAIDEYTMALADERWKTSAREFIWQIRPPESEEEKAEREFFLNGKARKKNGVKSPE